MEAGGSRYNISKLIQHPLFNISSTAVWHDIGLVKLDSEFEFTDTLQSIQIGEVLTNESCVISGWTVTQDGSPFPLEYIEVTALSSEDCSALGEGSEINDEVPRGPGQVCAFSPTGGIGACFSGAHDTKTLGMLLRRTSLCIF